MGRLTTASWVALLLAVSGLATAQETTPPAASDAARLDRLEQELARTRAELDAMKKGGAPEAAGAAAASGGPSAEAQGEKFEKKFGKDARVTWKDGFQMIYLDEGAEDPEKRVLHSLALNGRLMVDFREFVDEDHPQNDRFFLRRARLAAKGKFFKYHDVLIEFELGQFGAGIAEAYINLGYWKEFQLRFGQMKEPWGLERANSSRYLNFLERSMAKRWSGIDFDNGAMIHGDLGILTYQLAVQNGTGTGQPEGTAENNDSKDFGARIVLKPFNAVDDSPAKGLMIGGSYRFGHHDQSIPVFRTDLVDGQANPSGASQFYTFGLLNNAPTAATAITQRGQKRLWGGEFRINIAPVTIQAEYTGMRVKDVFGRGVNRRVDVDTRGGYVDLLVMLTGEEHRFSERVVPAANFDPKEGGMGAWQVGVRYDTVHVDDERGTLGAAGANNCEAVVFGLNWYLNQHTKVQLNYNVNYFNRDVAYMPRDHEEIFGVRLALEF